MKYLTEVYNIIVLKLGIMSELESRVGFFDQAVLSLIMIFIWTGSDMWGHSLWVNETDAMSYAEHGLSGFGYGYGGFVFLLHILWQLFGENDLVFRSLSLISSLLTMIVIYRICVFLHDRKSGIIASFIFLSILTSLVKRKFFATCWVIVEAPSNLFE